MPGRTIKLCFIAALFFLTEINAQVARFHQISIDDGLTQNSVTSFAQDKKGFIWIGTYAGLNKFDGYKITQYHTDPNDTNTISTDFIRNIYPDDENNLWLSTSGGGFCKFNLTTNAITRFLHDSTNENSLSSNSVHYITEFNKGTLYIATSKGLNIYDIKNNKFTHFFHNDSDANSLLANTIKTIARDKRGHIWLGHSGFGMTEYIPETNTFKRYTPNDATPSHLTEKTIRHIFVDGKGLIWISLWQSGINVLDPVTGKFYSSHDGSELMKPIERFGLVSQFYEDSKNNIWLCTAEDGLVKYNYTKKEVTQFENNPDDPESIIDNTVFSVLEDRNGIIWAGTWKGGLSYFDPRTLNFGYYKHESNKPSTLINNNVYSFRGIGNDQVLVGTAASICYFNTKEKTFAPFELDSKDGQSLVPKSIVLEIINDPDGSSWFGTLGGGIYNYSFKTKKFTNYPATADPSSLSYSSISGLVLDNANNLWVSTGNGLNLLDREKKTFERFLVGQENSKGLSSNVIVSMTKDKAGKIWLATGSAGISVLDPATKTFSNYFSSPDDKQLPDISLSTLFFDKKGTLWICSSGGLASMDPKTLAVKNYAKDIPELKIEFYAVAEDTLGNLWMSSINGLYRFDPRTSKLKIFTKEDGIQGKEFALRSLLKLDNGYLLFGGSNGFNYFSPADLIENTKAPEVILTNFQVLNKLYVLPNDISYTDNITLSYRDYFFSLNFAAVDYRSPEQNQFMYKLDGFNDDWVHIGNTNSVTFTNLDPGDYTLNIKAANSSGHWNENPLQIKITITPPFWKTTWFYLLCIITGALLIYAYIKYREKKLLQEKEVLEQKVEERTEELNLEKIKVEEAHKDIKDSIVYAQKIQSAIIPAEEEFKKLLLNSFVLFKPKDIVSGDFYWISSVGNLDFVAIADCTGHGVPGGFMTMLGNSLLNEIVNEQKITEPADILNKLREKIITSLKQTGKAGENQDGMDVVLLRIDKTKNELSYAAANNGFIIVNGETIKEYSGNKQPVGIYGDTQKPFDQFKVSLQKGDTIYSFTDGFPDQFGGSKGKKFKYKQLNQVLASNSSKPLSQQKEILNTEFESWKGNLEQIDDVCVVGIRV